MSRLKELEAKTERTPEEEQELLALKAQIDDDTSDPDKDEEEFDAAFEDALAEDDPDADKEGDADKDKDGDADADADDDDSKKDSADDDDQKADDIFVAPDKDKDQDSDGDADADQPKTPEELIAENEKLTQKMKSWEGRITAANKRADDAERKLQEQADSTQDKENAKKKADELPDGEDDDQVLKDFIEEFPSLEKPIKAMAMKIAKQVVDTKLKDFEPKLEKIDQIEQRTEAQVVKEHWDTIKTAHPDYEEIRDSGKLNEWVELQPSFVKQGLERVMKEGNAEEVVELFDAYKRSTGHGTSSSTKTKKKQTSKKAQDMAAVDGSSGGPKAGKDEIDEDDFDAAWDAATS